MVIKVLVSGISASKEVKKRQQRAMLILDSAQVDYFSIDITEPGRDDEKAKLLQAWQERKGEGTPLPPQFFNEETYLGDFEDFNSAVDVNEILQFLRLGKPDEATGSLYAIAGQETSPISRVADEQKSTSAVHTIQEEEQEDGAETTTEKDETDLLDDDEPERHVESESE